MGFKKNPRNKTTTTNLIPFMGRFIGSGTCHLELRKALMILSTMTYWFPMVSTKRVVTDSLLRRFLSFLTQFECCYPWSESILYEQQKPNLVLKFLLFCSAITLSFRRTCITSITTQLLHEELNRSAAPLICIWASFNESEELMNITTMANQHWIILVSLFCFF